MNAACPGFLYGLAVAQKFMQDGSHHQALVVGGEIVSHRTDFQDRNTCVLFGDGAGAVVLGQHTRKGEGEILSTRIYSDGDLWGLLNVPGGGSLNPPTHEMIDKRLHYVKMKGNEVFKHAVRSMIEASKAALEEGGISNRQIDWFIPHQANIRIIESVAKLMDVPMEKVILTVHKYGNTSAATIPTALDEAVRSGKIKRGDLVLTTSFGAGFTWGPPFFVFNRTVNTDLLAGIDSPPCLPLLLKPRSGPDEFVPGRPDAVFPEPAQSCNDALLAGPPLNDDLLIEVR